MDGKHIRKASPGDYILGIVSGQPCIIGNADEDWLGRWEHDEFGRFVKEYMEEEETEINPPDGLDGAELERWMLDNHVTQRYMEREDRPEWSAVGMLGVLAVRDDGSCQVNGYYQVAEDSAATAADAEITLVDGKLVKGYRVIQRVTENVVKVVFR